jgi:hypothetical protein
MILNKNKIAIQILLKENNESIEYQDAIDLKKIFEDYINQNSPNASGKILIYSNATLFGRDVKDIDLIIIGN